MFDSSGWEGEERLSFSERERECVCVREREIVCEVERVRERKKEH